MSDFANYSKRSVDLPKGCTDLIDVIRNQCADPPNTFSTRTTEGLRDLEAHLTRFQCSADDYGMLPILSFDLESGVYVHRSKNILSSIVVVTRAGPAVLAALRESFTRASLSPVWDEVPAGAGGARVLKYLIPPSCPQIVPLLCEALRVACGATDHAGLYYNPCRDKTA
jgi:hypothetical protein